jgi:hypothetical protein
MDRLAEIVADYFHADVSDSAACLARRLRADTATNTVIFTAPAVPGRQAVVPSSTSHADSGQGRRIIDGA